MSGAAESSLWQTIEHAYSTDHPTAAGHFPGNPIIPGALLLDHVLRAMALPEALREVRSAKFLRPVRPGDRVVIRWRALDNNDVAFECRLAVTDEPALVGSLVGKTE